MVGNASLSQGLFKLRSQGHTLIKRNRIPGKGNSLCKGPAVRKRTDSRRSEKGQYSWRLSGGQGERCGGDAGMVGGTGPQRAL